MFDCAIVGGTIIDGTGQPGFRADIGIRDGRIACIGTLPEPASNVIDATGRIVSPGFIDVHTHYDAQAFWDPTFSPSCYHGVTTIIGGFCGFSIAPLTPASASYLKPMLARVEGMPLETLECALDWNWSSFASYLARLDGRIGLNAGFFAGHSAIRRVVMGERAVGSTATPDEIAEMQSLLGESLAGGALGFSTTLSPSHEDGDGKPVPSRWADREELLALANVVGRHEGTGLELLPDLTFPPGTPELMADFSAAGNRPVNWNILVVMGGAAAAARVERQLAVSDFARARGAEVIALTVPSTPATYMRLTSPASFSALPGIWRELDAQPLETRIARMRDPQVRESMARAAQDLLNGGSMLANFGLLDVLVVVAASSPENERYVDRSLGSIAAEEGRAVIDVFCDIAIADRLDTIFAPDRGGNERATWELRGRVWQDDRTLIGASDAGAHLDQIDTFAFSTTVLQKGVREHRVIGLEQAIHLMTQRPATYFGLRDRGVIREGFHADLVVFDPDSVGRGPTYLRHDLPGDDRAYRIYADAEGIDHVLVNGVEIIRKGVHTSECPGTVLRSGRDTCTVAMDALRAA